MNFNLLTTVFLASMTLGALHALPAIAGQDGSALMDPNEQESGSVRPDIRMKEQILACENNENSGPARVLVNVKGMQDQKGNVRIQVYGDDPEQFLQTGAKLLRIDVPAEKKMKICVTFPSPGDYAIVVLHDRDADGRADILSEGFGFSRNPALLFSAPDHDEVVIRVAGGVTEINVTLKYLMDSNKRGRKGRRRR